MSLAGEYGSNNSISGAFTITGAYTDVSGASITLPVLASGRSTTS